MLHLELPTIIQRIIESLYRLRFWHRNDEETATERGLQLFYVIFYSSLPAALAAGIFKNGNQDEIIFLIEGVATSLITFMKLWYLIYRQKEMYALLIGISNFEIDDRHTFNVINDKLKMLMRFVAIFLSLSGLALFPVMLVLPFIGSGRKLFFPIGFPLDWRQDESAYWIASIYISIQMALTGITLLFSVIVWNLIAGCSWRYFALGQQMRKLGEARTSNIERDNLFLRDLVVTIKSANDLKELTDQLQSLLANFFAAEFAASGMCICVSLYCIAFVKGESSIECIVHLAALAYHIFDLFMITFYGNEIKLASDRLTYCLFESNWVDRPQTIKKKILIFCEILRSPRMLTALKIYPLILVTFTRIMNSAYGMFNILKSFK